MSTNGSVKDFRGVSGGHYANERNLGVQINKLTVSTAATGTGVVGGASEVKSFGTNTSEAVTETFQIQIDTTGAGVFEVTYAGAAAPSSADFQFVTFAVQSSGAAQIPVIGEVTASGDIVVGGSSAGAFQYLLVITRSS